jgi:hypothetical protein
MFTNNFLTYYCFFTAAITAYRSAPQDVRNLHDEETAASAFKKATAGISKTEQTALLLFVLRLIQQPEQFSQNRDYRYKTEAALDREIAKQFPEIVNTNRIIIETEFLTRSELTKEELSQKLRERRLFNIPEWIHKDPGEEYYPAFFVDPQYDQSSLEQVSVALRAFPGERKYRFFTTPVPTFENKTPLEILASGEVERVAEIAKAFRRRTGMPSGDT